MAAGPMDRVFARARLTFGWGPMKKEKDTILLVVWFSSGHIVVSRIIAAD